MIGLLMAAGLGTRLKPLTNKTPKCLVEVGGKPVIERLIDKLHKELAIDKVIVNLHHLPLAVMRHFGTRVLFMYEPALLGEWGTIQLAKFWSEELVVMNADTVTEINLKEMYHFHNTHPLRETWFWDERYAGTKMISGNRQHEGHTNFVPDPMPFWKDIGTPKKLKEARDYYEKAFNLSKV